MKTHYRLLMLAVLLSGCSLAPTDFEKRLALHQQSAGAGTVESAANPIPVERQYPNGEHYRGMAVAGKPHGEGVLTLENGDVFEGTFSRGRMMTGTLRTRQGDVYQGEFMLGQYHRQGRLQKANGDIFEGTFHYGELKQGKKIYADGKRLSQGIFSKDKIVGVHQKANGDVMKGDINTEGGDYILDGTGYFYDASEKIVYRTGQGGKFNRNRKQGPFQAELANGMHFYQIWKNNKRVYEAFGGDYLKQKQEQAACNTLLSNKKWVVTLGRCVNGKLHGQGVITYIDSSMEFRGQFDAGRPVSGEIVYADGHRYEGTFNARLQPHGDNIAAFKDNEKQYYGGFQNGVRAGYGLCNDGASSLTQCEYHNGKRIDPVHLAHVLTKKLEDLSSEHRDYVTKKVNGEIRKEKKRIRDRYESEISRLERELKSYNTNQNVGAVFNMMSDYAAGNDRSAAYYAAELNQKKEQKRREIEQRKQQFRQEMSQKEQYWASQRASQLQTHATRYVKQRDALIAEYRQQCLSLPGRSWESGVCVPESGLSSGQVETLNGFLARRGQAESKALDVADQALAQLNRFQRDSAEHWQGLDSKARQADQAARSSFSSAQKWTNFSQQLSSAIATGNAAAGRESMAGLGSGAASSGNLIGSISDAMAFSKTGQLPGTGSPVTTRSSAKAAAITGPGVNAEGYRHFPYTFTCNTGISRTVKVPYKSQAGLELTKQYAKAASCNHIEEMQRLAKQCEMMNRPHCIER